MSGILEGVLGVVWAWLGNWRDCDGEVLKYPKSAVISEFTYSSF